MQNPLHLFRTGGHYSCCFDECLTRQLHLMRWWWKWWQHPLLQGRNWSFLVVPCFQILIDFVRIFLIFLRLSSFNFSRIPLSGIFLPLRTKVSVTILLLFLSREIFEKVFGDINSPKQRLPLLISSFVAFFSFFWLPIIQTLTYSKIKNMTLDPPSHLKVLSPPVVTVFLYRFLFNHEILLLYLLH